MKKVTVLGDGAWGTACATLLAHNGYEVSLWCQNDEVAYSINNQRVNTTYLPGVSLSESIHATTNAHDAVTDSEFIFEAIPVKYLRATLEGMKPLYHKNQCWIVLSKGIEADSLLLPSQIIDDVFKTAVTKVVLSGPSFAADLAAQQPTAVDSAGDHDVAVTVQKMVKNNYFFPTMVNDLVGVQVGGAFKNIIAMAIGMIQAKGYGDNAQVLLATRMFHEMVEIAIAIGGKGETLYGLSGMGDMMLTAFGKQSKNRTFGEKLGTDAHLALTTEHMPEGINTLRSVMKLKQKYGLALPLFTALYQIIFEQKPVASLFDVAV